MVTFYFGSKENIAGGVQTLILNIAKGYNNLGEVVKIITCPTSFIYRQAISRQIKFIYIDIGCNYKEYLDKDDVIVCFGTLELHLNLFANLDLRLFYWSVFPDVLINTFQIKIPFLINKYNNRNIISRYFTRKLSNILAEKCSAFFMDDSHLAAIELYGIKNTFYRENLLPIPFEIESDIYFDPQKSVKCEPVKLAYIGRAEDWKIYPFVRLIQDIINLNYGNQVKVTLITENGQEYLKYLDNTGLDYSGIEMQIIENMYGTRLSEFLYKEIHIVFAMGYSLLEACKVFVPAVIIDPSYNTIPDGYLYRFLFQEKGYSTGLPAWVSNIHSGYPLKEILDSLRDETKYQELAEKSFNYANRNHELNNWMPKFINVVSRSKMKMADLKWVSRVLSTKQKLYYIFDRIIRSIKR